MNTFLLPDWPRSLTDNMSSSRRSIIDVLAAKNDKFYDWQASFNSHLALVTVMMITPRRSISRGNIWLNLDILWDYLSLKIKTTVEMSSSRREASRGPLSWPACRGRSRSGWPPARCMTASCCPPSASRRWPQYPSNTGITMILKS